MIGWRFWHGQRISGPARAVASALTGVSCASARAGIAVGYDFNRSGSMFSLVERWNGRQWVRDEQAVGGGVLLSGVSCTSARACTAVGVAGNRTLAEHWNGRFWASLAGVSCTSARVCMAVGRRAGDKTLILRHS